MIDKWMVSESFYKIEKWGKQRQQKSLRKYNVKTSIIATKCNRPWNKLIPYRKII